MNHITLISRNAEWPKPSWRKAEKCFALCDRERERAVILESTLSFQPLTSHYLRDLCILFGCATATACCKFGTFKSNSIEANIFCWTKIIAIYLFGIFGEWESIRLNTKFTVENVHNSTAISSSTTTMKEEEQTHKPSQWIIQAQKWKWGHNRWTTTTCRMNDNYCRKSNHFQMENMRMNLNTVWVSRNEKSGIFFAKQSLGDFIAILQKYAKHKSIKQI